MVWWLAIGGRVPVDPLQAPLPDFSASLFLLLLFILRKKRGKARTNMGPCWVPSLVLAVQCPQSPYSTLIIRELPRGP